MKTLRLKFLFVLIFTFHLVQAQPYQYKDCEFIRIVFLTSQDVLNRLVPKPLNANPQGLIILDIGLQKIERGLNYHEMTLTVPSEYNGKAGMFSSILYLDNIDAITGGREIWGFPKYYANITFQKDDKHISAQVHKGTQLLVDASLDLGNSVENYKMDDPLVFIQKFIPSAEEGLIDVNQINSVYISNCTFSKYYQADAELIISSIPDGSIGEIPIIKIIDASYFEYDYVLGFGKLEYDYLQHK